MSRHIIILCLQHLNPNRYTGPESAARELSKQFSAEERSTAKILDVAAGTGRLGAEVTY
jgi:predicted RNA methylase